MDIASEKALITAREVLRLNRNIEDVSFSLSQKVALTCRILHQEGHDSGLSGQITARLDNGGFMTQRLGLGFDEITSSSLLVVDQDLKVLSGTGMPNPANRFHRWIYEARSDVNCIVHTHAFYTAALSVLREPLVVTHTDSCVLFDSVAYLPDWPGIPIGNGEGEIITKALSNKKAVLLSHHGLLTAGASVEEACILALQFERSAKLQIAAMSAGKIAPVQSELALEAREWLSQPKRVSATFAYYARRALREADDVLS